MFIWKEQSQGRGRLRKKLGSADRGPIGQLAGLFDSAKQDTSREQAVVLQVVVPLANIAPRGEALRRAR